VSGWWAAKTWSHPGHRVHGHVRARDEREREDDHPHALGGLCVAREQPERDEQPLEDETECDDEPERGDTFEDGAVETEPTANAIARVTARVLDLCLLLDRMERSAVGGDIRGGW
jgi:hypothetical protein